MASPDRLTARKEFAQQAVLVLGLLGGISFAVLVLVLEYPDKFEPSSVVIFENATMKDSLLIHGHNFFVGLVAILATASLLSIVGSISMMFVASAWLVNSRAVELVGVACLGLGAFAIVISIPFLLFSFTPKGSEYMTAVISIVIGIFLFSLLHSNGFEDKVIRNLNKQNEHPNHPNAGQEPEH